MGFGSFTAGNLTGVARSTLPIVPPTCPPSPLPSARAVAPPACLCKPCPRGTSSAFSGLPIEVAACFVPSAPTFARRGSAYVTGLAVYYHAALATIFGVEATYADGTRLLSGVRTGSVQSECQGGEAGAGEGQKTEKRATAEAQLLSSKAQTTLPPPPQTHTNTRAQT